MFIHRLFKMHSVFIYVKACQNLYIECNQTFPISYDWIVFVSNRINYLFR